MDPESTGPELSESPSTRNGAAPAVERVELCVDETVTHEYSRFLVVNSMLNTALSLATAENGRLAITDIIEKWIRSVANLLRGGDPVFRTGFARDATGEIDDRFVQTLIESSVTDQDTAQALLDFMRQRVESFLRGDLSSNPPRHAVIETNEQTTKIRYGLLSRSLSTVRYKRLRELGSLEDLVTVCLRYASIISAAN